MPSQVRVPAAHLGPDRRPRDCSEPRRLRVGMKRWRKGLSRGDRVLVGSGRRIGKRGRRFTRQKPRAVIDGIEVSPTEEREAHAWVGGGWVLVEIAEAENLVLC